MKHHYAHHFEHPALSITCVGVMIVVYTAFCIQNQIIQSIAIELLLLLLCLIPEADSSISKLSRQLSQSRIPYRSQLS